MYLFAHGCWLIYTPFLSSLVIVNSYWIRKLNQRSSYTGSQRSAISVRVTLAQIKEDDQ